MLDLETLSGQGIVILGQTKNFAVDEIEELLQLDGIQISKSVQSNSAVVVAGRLLNPLLEAELEQLEKDPKLTVVGIDAFEKSLAASIHHEGLFLSLKLSHDNERVRSYLCNTLITDSTFLTLLPLFDWEGETLFGNDANRDICAALTRRFYPKVIRNHNIEYSPNGIHETALESENGALLGSLLGLAPIQEGFKAGEKTIEHQILEAVAGNKAASSETLKILAKHDDGRLAPLIAVSEKVDAQTAMILFDRKEPQVLAALGCNKAVDERLRVSLLDGVSEVSLYMAEHAPLNETLFNAIFLLLPELAAVGRNSSLSSLMVKKLFGCGVAEVRAALAGNPLVDTDLLKQFCESGEQELLPSLALNPKISPECFERLSALNEEAIDVALAKNVAAPKALLARLAGHESEQVVRNIAANPGTPVETLYQLLLDFRYATYVKANASFGENIRQEIGWES